MRIWFGLVRLRQWNKQALIILPLIALGDSVRVSDLGRLIWIALAFSFVASSVYVLNDLQDMPLDKLDPVKSRRPLAAGEISALAGGLVGFLLFLTGCIIAFTATDKTNRLHVMSLFLVYLASNLVYSIFHLKRVRIIGLILVSLGFAIRFSIGTFVLDLKFSTWAFVLIILLTMFMLSGKGFKHSCVVHPLRVVNVNFSFGCSQWLHLELFLQPHIQVSFLTLKWLQFGEKRH